MIFSEYIELARQKIAAQAHEFEDTPSDLVVRRWKYDDDFGDRFVYDGQSLPDLDSDHERSDYDLESDGSDSDLEYRCHYRVGWGTCIWKSVGARYDGWWSDHVRDGWGLMMYPDGTVIEGDWVNGDLSDTSAIMWLRDGSRCIVGSWKSTGIPESGAMMEANGDVYYFENNNSVRLFYMESMERNSRGTTTPRLSRLDGSIDGETAWAMAVRAMTDEDSPQFAGLVRQLVGRVVVGGAPMPGCGVRAVRVELADGGTYVGPMRGLSYWSFGVMTDALGGAWITNSDKDSKDWDKMGEDYGRMNIADPDMIGRTEKKVPETLAVLFSVHGFPSSDSESLPFIRAAAEAGGACGARRCAGRARRVEGGDMPVFRNANERVTFASRARIPCG